jgi:predicted glycoside hydrolase/deacetylase ChbG (UPF0249 family)
MERVNGQRYLVVVADDYGIGPATSQGILDLGVTGLVTGAVLLVNSPYAEDAVRAWRGVGRPFELGWHPCLTMDRPVLPASQVPSLVNREGYLWPLNRFLARVLLGRIRAAEVTAELRAQYRRFQDLVGQSPTVVNSHQHASLFPPVGSCLLEVLHDCRPLPYVRRVRERWATLARVPGARLKRSILSALGLHGASRQERMGFPGNDLLAGITDPPCVRRPDYLVHWLSRVPGVVVELACHPGYWDQTLIGRDCSADDGRLLRRVDELHLLRQSSFALVCRQAGFTLAAPSEVLRLRAPEPAQAA